ncbi:hypothetical protein [Pseudonocardia kujensis]|uniref:hypothetical protein n=1 Tax=Pseudonocardia kujensis TaxID=1128675 RepID=UPI001E603A78|nr:hypothetical protein [Pseudonocardia kujensis]
MVETIAMGHAAALAGRGQHDSVGELDAAAFATAQIGPDAATGELWSIWSLSRSRAHVTAMLQAGTSADVLAAAALLDAGHAALSAAAHEHLGDQDAASACRQRALEHTQVAHSTLTP